jgi:hypothetical protein
MAAGAQQASPILLDAMTTELHRAFTSLGKQGLDKTESDKQLPPYFLSYSVSDATAAVICRCGWAIPSWTTRTEPIAARR